MTEKIIDRNPDVLGWTPVVSGTRKTLTSVRTCQRSGPGREGLCRGPGALQRSQM